MLAEHNLIMSGSFPSFQSVFGEESGLYRPGALDDQSKVEDAFPLMTTQTAHTQTSQQHEKPYNHRGSITSLFSESTDSSPTTTNSTFDSPTVSDQSATSSPESATSLAPSVSFQSTMIPTEQQSTPPHNGDGQFAANTQGLQTMQDTTKNVKKLTLDINLPNSQQRPATENTLDAPYPLSAPASPLKEPMKSARRKPNNLTIRTPGYNQLTFPRAAGNVPSTPSSRPFLHHMQSSPSLVSLASPRNGPAGGMFLPLPTLNTQHSKQNSSSSNGSSFMASSMPDLREESESLLPKSQEAPERGYTEGPVCIYDCGVYLYLEPTAVEASGFDTIINVAKEVKNPFSEEQEGEGTILSVWRGDQPQTRSAITEPQTAVSEFSFKSAWEWPQPENTVTPTAATPTQSSFSSRTNRPEYLHVKWDHNSEILGDLYALCKLIDDRTAQGKKVLVHCQLGVSRSASLIIAYGLYKNYQPSFHSMYTSVKERSRWVGPNMSLIYQLTDFKNKLNQGDYAQGFKEAQTDWFMKSPRDPTIPATTDSAPAVVASDPTDSFTTAASASGDVSEQRTTPVRLNKALPPVPLFPKHEITHQEVPQATPIVTPVPVRQEKPANTVKRAASRPLPFRERNMDMSIPAHKPRELGSIAVSRAPAVMDLAMKDVPSTPSLFSPRTTEFMANPFGVRGAGDLQIPGNRQSKEIPSSYSWLPVRKEGHVRTASMDPRSPHQQAEAKEIYGSIDTYL